MSSLKMIDASGGGKRYWRSLDELADAPEFRKLVEREFPAFADEMLEPTSRRNFLRLMGASLALAGATSCRWPSEEILPFARRPENYTPGTPMHYATAMELGGVATGLLATSFDGRPIKIEGNPEHPSSLGATGAMAQAAVLELYDPDRSRQVLRREGGELIPSDWNAFERFARERISAGRDDAGRRLRVLSEATSSPSLARVKRRFLEAFPQARWYEYEALSRDGEREGTEQAFGKPHRVHPRLDRAQVVVSLDEDFLAGHPHWVRLARDFVAGRDPEGHEFSRLYVVESCYSLTGTMADHRVPVAASMIPVVAGCLGANLLLEHGLEFSTGSEALTRMLERFQAHPFYTEIDWSMARDLVAHAGHSLLLAGPRQPPAVHALVHVLNAALGNAGKTVHYTADPDPRRQPHTEAIRDLAAEIAVGGVDTLVMLGGNPAYDAPVDTHFEQLLGEVETSIHLSLHDNETSRLATWHLPRAHFLESWGDARDWDGNVSLVQPLIEPLFGGRTPIELVSLLTDGTPRKGYDLVRATFGAEARGESAWRRALHDGLIADSAWPSSVPRLERERWVDQLAPFLRTHARFKQDEAELVFVPDSRVHDGRFANSGWMQELPDPLTKLTWDNAALIGPSTAERLGVAHGDMVRLEDPAGRGAEFPVYVMPGQAPGTVGLHLGFGRRHAGRVGDGVGFDAYVLRTSDRMGWTPVRVERARGKYLLATTQNHYAIDPLGSKESDERSTVLAREVELADYHDHHDDHGHGYHEAPLWKEWEYHGHKWGMAIDLNSCIGCNACIAACTAENNVPVVGKEEVDRGREMHWLRVDRYFSGDPDDPSVTHQPLTCQHCENAPCEQVCPVAATVHDSEGLNVMIYNRCVGTRYCMNNCPYKVRRFNYFNNHKNESALEMMVYNPEVTVRSRGVMEKCSFCLQRINGAKITAKNEGRPLADGEVTTACEQVCPTRAITFGDLNDEASRVRLAQESRRAYGLLEWLNVKPRARYLTRVRNRNSGDGSSVG